MIAEQDMIVRIRAGDFDRSEAEICAKWCNITLDEYVLAALCERVERDRVLMFADDGIPLSEESNEGDLLPVLAYLTAEDLAIAREIGTEENWSLSEVVDASLATSLPDLQDAFRLQRRLSDERGDRAKR